MIRFTSFAAIALFASVVFAAEPQTAPEEKPGMRSLFNGKDLTGWDGDLRLWSVKDGVIHGETTKENAAKGNTFLIWQEGETKDFELRLSFRCNATNNSGIQYRSEHLTESQQTTGLSKGISTKSVTRTRSRVCRDSSMVKNWIEAGSASWARKPTSAKTARKLSPTR